MNKTLIYIADVTPLNDPALYEKYYNLVKDKRKEKINTYKLSKDKVQSLGAECLLIKACLDFNIDYQDMRLLLNKYGKPYFESSNVFFNLSHSHDKAMCIISYNECGCDIEQIKESNIRVKEKYFSKREQEEDFYKVWTLKESYIKCLGEGLKKKLNSFDVFDLSSDFVTGSKIIDNYYFSWCIKSKDAEVEIIEYTIE